MTFQRLLTVHLRDTDSTGVIYFAELQRMAQETIEFLLQEKGLSMGHLVEQGSFLLPIVHAEADYLAPIKASDQLKVVMGCSRIGDKSYTLEFDFENLTTNKKVGKVKLVQVTVDKATFTSIALPTPVKQMLQEIQLES